MTRVLGPSHMLDEEPLTEMKKQVLGAKNRSSILGMLHWRCQVDNWVTTGKSGGR